MPWLYAAEHPIKQGPEWVITGLVVFALIGLIAYLFRDR